MCIEPYSPFICGTSPRRGVDIFRAIASLAADLVIEALYDLCEPLKDHATLNPRRDGL